jgi:hypothetical protein
MKLSPDGSYLACYNFNSIFSLIDTKSGMVRYSYNKIYPLGMDSNSFSFGGEEVPLDLYYLFHRSKDILSISRLNLSKFDEKRIFSIRVSSSSSESISAMGGKFILLSTIPKGELSPSIYMIGYFGKSPVEIVKNGSFPIIVREDLFYFLKNGEIYSGTISPVNTDKFKSLLLSYNPQKSLSILKRFGNEFIKNNNLNEFYSNLEENSQNISAGLLYYRGKLLEELKHKKLASIMYKKIIKRFQLSKFYESALSSLERCEEK